MYPIHIYDASTMPIPTTVLSYRDDTGHPTLFPYIRDLYVLTFQFQSKSDPTFLLLLFSFNKRISKTR